MKTLRIPAEKLAYWYLRLNGFLTTINFVVHPEVGTVQRTDVDILGVRFPHRAEKAGSAKLEDDAVFTSLNDKLLIVIAEVKPGKCKLNGPWTNSDTKVMEDIVGSIGCFRESEIAKAAQALYRQGWFDHSLYHVCLVCFGQRKGKLDDRYSKVPQITYDQILDFIYKRFCSHKRSKVQHRQWDCWGQMLWESVKESPTAEEFRNKVFGTVETDMTARRSK